MAGVQGGCHRCAGVLYVITVVFLSARSVKCYRLEGRINTAQNWKLMTWLCLKDSARLNFEFQSPKSYGVQKVLIYYDEQWDLVANKDCTERVNVLPSNNNQIFEMSNTTCSTVTTDTGQHYYYCLLERTIRSSKPRRWHFVLARCEDSESGETGLRAKYTLNTTDTAISNCSVSLECPVSREEDGVLTCTCYNISKYLQGGLESAPTGNGTGPANTENPSDSCHVMATGHTGVVTYTLLNAERSINLTLTCQTSQPSLAPRYHWEGVACDNGNQGSTCTFASHLPWEEGTNVMCTAVNPACPAPENDMFTSTLSCSSIDILAPSIESSTVSGSSAAMGVLVHTRTARAVFSLVMIVSVIVTATTTVIG